MARARPRWATVVVALACGSVALGGQQISARVLDLLNRFDRGDVTGALTALDGMTVRDPMPTDFAKTATFWIQAVPADLTWHRTLVASVFALEVGGRFPPNPHGAWPAAPLVLWAMDELRAHPEPTPTERWASVVALAELETHDGWPLVLDAALRASPSDDGYRLLAAKQGSTGLMTKIRARFPDDPRLTLAALETREYATAFAAAPVLSVTSLLAKDAVRPADLSALQALANVPVVAKPKTAAEYAAAEARTAARDALMRTALLPDLIKDLTTLSAVESVRGDVELHLGYLLGRTEAWDDATAHLAQVTRLSADPELAFLTAYVRGWIAHCRGDHAASLEAYRQALADRPADPSVSWGLAAELLLTADAEARSEARTVLTGMRGSEDARDPLLTYYTGEAWRLPAYLDQLLTSLPPR